MKNLKLKIVIILSTFAFSLCLLSNTEANEFKPIRSKAFDALNNNQPQEALEILESSLDKETDLKEKVLSYFLIADVYNKLELPDEAFKQYDIIIKIDPSNANAYFKKANVLMQSLDFEDLHQAIVNYKKSYSLGFSSPQIFYGQGSCYKIFMEEETSDSEKIKEYYNLAKDNFVEALKMIPDDIATLGKLANMEHQMENYLQALKYYLELNILNPNNPMIQARIGHSFLQLKQPTEARAYLTQAQDNLYQQKRDADADHKNDLFILELDIHLHLAQAYINSEMPLYAEGELNSLLGKTDVSFSDEYSFPREIYRYQIHTLLEKINL